MFVFWKILLFSCFLKGMSCQVEEVDVTITEGTLKRSDNSKASDHRTVEIKKEGKIVQTFDLQRQPLLLSDDFEITTQDKEGNTIPYDKEKMKKDCIYEGTVRGEENSLAIFSLCNGIKGFYEYKNSSFDVDKSLDPNTKAKLTKLEKPKKQYRCGTKADFIPEADRAKRGYFENVVQSEMRGIEVYLIIDSSFYKSFDKSMRKTLDFVSMVFSQTNKYYNWLNLFLILKRIEVWPVKDEFEYYNKERKPENIIYNFLDYKATSNINSVDHDLAFLFHNLEVGDEERGLVLGQGLQSTACNLEANILWISRMNTSDIEYISEILAHEMGHTLGLDHIPDFVCPPDAKCFMIYHAVKATKWSDYSKYLIDLFLRSSRSFCLTEHTKNAEAVCGDGIIVNGEECDCGEIPVEFCNKKCCDDKCHLTKGSQCSTGMCCDLATCQLKKKGEVCIKSDGECNEDSMCDGKSTLCKNTFNKKITKCHDDGYCYKGKCRTLNQACMDAMGLFANKVAAGNDKCYNLEKLPKYMAKYQSQLRGQTDAKCGVLFCQVDEIQNSEQVLIKLDIDHFNCTWSQMFPLKMYDHINSMYVPEGTKCGDDKICNKRKCIPFEEFSESEEIPKDSGDTYYLGFNKMWILAALIIFVVVVLLLVAIIIYAKRMKKTEAVAPEEGMELLNREEDME